jgi:hypothetical protein
MSLLTVVYILFISFISTRILCYVLYSIPTVYILIYLATISQLRRLCYVELSSRIIIDDILKRISEKWP